VTDPVADGLLLGLRLLTGGLVVTALVLAWRGGALRGSGRKDRPARRWLFTALAFVVFWLTVVSVRGRLDEPDEVRATVLAALITLLVCMVAGLVTGAIVAALARKRRR
jgi:apolipoprotein N-acyltransferase